MFKENIKKFRKAKNIPFWVWTADRVFFRMMSHRFYALRIKNLEAFKEKCSKDYPSIFYAPHMNWWDGIAGYNLMRRVFNVKRVRMMIEEMNRFPLFSLAGAFPVNKASAQTAMESLKSQLEAVEADIENARNQLGEIYSKLCELEK